MHKMLSCDQIIQLATARCIGGGPNLNLDTIDTLKGVNKLLFALGLWPVKVSSEIWEIIGPLADWASGKFVWYKVSNQLCVGLRESQKIIS